MMNQEDFLNDLLFTLSSEGVRQHSFSDFPTHSPNPKVLIKSYIDNLFKMMNLKNPVLVTTAFPRSFTFQQRQNEEGSVVLQNRRGIVVSLKSINTIKSIGNVIRDKVYGFLEDFRMEIYFWSIDSLDRDYGGDFLKQILLEGFESKYFLIKGLSAFTIDGSRDDEEVNTLEPNSIVYKHIIDVSGIRLLVIKREDDPGVRIGQINISVEPIPSQDDFSHLSGTLSYFDNANLLLITNSLGCPSAYQLLRDTPILENSGICR